MLEKIKTALSKLPCKILIREGEKADFLPAARITLSGDESLYRCDGQDYIRRLTFLISVFSFEKEEAQALSGQIRDIVTQPPFSFSRTFETPLFDENRRVFENAARYQVTAETGDL